MKPFNVATVPGKTPEELGCDQILRNDVFTVFVRSFPNSFFGPCRHLSIKRNDKKPIRDWRQLQEVKNAICGPEWEAIELFPAESRLVDEANQYHLYAFPIKLPFGDHQGRRTSTKAEAAISGARQRNGRR